MIYLLAGLAFFVAMAALYLASEASRKADRQIQEFLATYMAPIKESNAKNIATVKNVQTKIKTLQVELKAIRETQTETLDRMTRQDNVLQATRAELAKLDRSIPPQFEKGGAGPGAT